VRPGVADLVAEDLPVTVRGLVRADLGGDDDDVELDSD
jgi:hypothetical protein